MYPGGTLPGHSPWGSALSTVVVAVASTLSTDRCPSPACTDFRRNRLRKLRIPIVLPFVFVVWVGQDQLLAFFRLDEVAGPRRTERQVVRLSRASPQLRRQLVDPPLEHQSIASIASASSSERNGSPRTRLKPTASTRNSARTS